MTAKSNTGQRGKVLAALFAALGAGLILTSAGRDWAHGTVTTPVRLAVGATGTSLTALPYALALAALASSVALFAVRRIGRYAVGVVLLGAGAGTVAAVAGKLGSLDTALAAKAATQSAMVAGSRVSGASNTAWPYVAIIGGLLIAYSGGYTLLRGRSWTGLSNRYDVGPAATESPEPGTPQREATTRDLWDALNRGADPTA
jgi:uncharacterized membrane protein (TIGR02234 family)